MIDWSKEGYDVNCNTCVFNMGVCAGRSDIYGFAIDEVQRIFPSGCEEYEPDINTYIKIESSKEKEPE